MRIEAGRFRGRPLPRAHDARPVGARLRKSLFSVLAPRLEGSRVLDVFAGVGGLGLEALSRGAAHVVLVDRDARATRALEEWLERAGARTEATVRRGDVLRGALPDGPFDLVFLDPPYALWTGSEAAGVVARCVRCLAPGGVVAAKVPASLDLEGLVRTRFGRDFRLARRHVVGSSAWALLGAPGDDGGGPAEARPEGGE